MSAPSQSKLMTWTGWVLTGAAVLFLAMDGAMKLVPIQPVLDAAAQLGWPEDAQLWRLLGAVLLASTALYAYPRTSLLGAVLLTAYLGGAIATHLRIGSPLLTHTFFGVYVGLLVWAGLWLRAPRLRTAMY